MLFLILICLLAVVLVSHYLRNYSRFSGYGVKHHKVLPLFGNLLKLFLRIEHFTTGIDVCYNFPGERFVGRYELLKPIIILKDLNLVKAITKKDFEHFLDHRNFFNGCNDVLYDRNLLSLKGQEWKDMRSTLRPLFSNPKIKLMVPFIEEVGEQMIRVMQSKIKESANGAADFDCKDLSFRCANDVIATCAFGLKVDSHTDVNNEVYKMGSEIANFGIKQIIHHFLLTVTPTIAKKFDLRVYPKRPEEFFINLLTRTMKDRVTRNIIRHDLIHLLLKAKKGQLAHDDIDSFENGDYDRDFSLETIEESDVNKKSTYREWSDIDLIAQAVFFYVAGVDTTSTSFSFTLHELATHPDVQDRLYQEIKENHIKCDSKLDYTAIQNLKYLDMVISEVLRMWPPLVAADRMCTKDYNLGKPNSKAAKDYIIRKGELLWIPIWSIHRDPEFFPDPDKFDPERFSDEKSHLFNRMAYMPFGLGPRYCIGSKLALCELKIFLYQIILHTEVSPSLTTCLPPKLSTATFLPLLKGGHWLTFKLRS